jgi:cysteine desulfurase / selenocysteine lyase
VHDITPDFIARLASRIYNEPARGNGESSAAGHAPAMPDPPVSPPVASNPFGHFPAAATSHAPFQTTMPSRSPMPGAHSMHGAHSMPGAGSSHGANSMAGANSMPGAHSMPGAGSLPNAGTMPGGASMPNPDSMPGVGLIPGLATNIPTTATIPNAPSFPTFAGAPPTPAGSPDGLQSFLQNVRRSHFDGTEQLRDAAGHPSHRQPTFLSTHGSSRPLDVPAIRKDFPVLQQRVHGKQLAWLDNAATTQKPQCVIDAISHFYENDYSNIHRGAHTLAARATDAYEKARQKVQSFLGASSVKEIVFVRGTTEGINLVAQTYGRKFLQPGDEIVLSTLEHHAQIVPWQMIAKEKAAVLRIIPVNDRGEIMLEEYQKILGPRTKLVGLTQASNSLGTILPVAEMTQMAKRYGARVILDGAQSVAHIPVNMQQLGCDFFVFSGHKIFGPTGIGAVYIKEELHDILPPWQGGGNMIQNVTFEETTFSHAPARFEAGTPNIADAVGLGAALDYVNRLGLPNIGNYEHELTQYGTEQLSKINGLRLIGTAREKVGVLSFVLPNRRTEDVGRLLDQEGIAVRAGHHCSQPSLRRFGVETTVRPSLSFYNTTAEIDRLVDAIKRIQRLP